MSKALDAVTYTREALQSLLTHVYWLSASCYGRDLDGCGRPCRGLVLLCTILENYCWGGIQSFMYNIYNKYMSLYYIRYGRRIYGIATAVAS